jgi:hypothetical protein
MVHNKECGQWRMSLGFVEALPNNINTVQEIPERFVVGLMWKMKTWSK